MKRLHTFLILLLVLITLAFSDEVYDYRNDFSYKPYPVLLIHGLGNGPWAMGLLTEKDSSGVGNKRMSTYIDTMLNEHIGTEFVKYFNDIADFQDTTIYDYERDSILAKVPDRFYPYEEWDKETYSTSYTQKNHSYIEAFCANWGNESADGSGVAKPEFYGYFGIMDTLRIEVDTLGDISLFERLSTLKKTTDYFEYHLRSVEVTDTIKAEEIDSLDHDSVFEASRLEMTTTVYESKDPVGYDISDGGNTQLLRIRIIQMLNEYYGDFKWVGDPEAKINVIAKSLGGLEITNILANEEHDGWYNQGRNRANEASYKDLHVEDAAYYCENGERYVIDGYGFKLRDHINHVVTIGSPLDGGFPGKLVDETFWDIYATVVTAAVTSPAPLTKLGSIIGSFALPGVYEEMMTDLEEDYPGFKAAGHV